MCYSHSCRIWIPMGKKSEVMALGCPVSPSESHPSPDARPAPGPMRMVAAWIVCSQGCGWRVGSGRSGPASPACVLALVLMLGAVQLPNCCGHTSLRSPELFPASVCPLYPYVASLALLLLEHPGDPMPFRPCMHGGRADSSLGLTLGWNMCGPLLGPPLRDLGRA